MVVQKIETPYLEHGIIDHRSLVRQVLGSVASDYQWQGSFVGPHHLMWPRRLYPHSHDATSPEGIAAQYRSSPSLQIIIQREAHMYLHQVTEPPVRPSLEVMYQYNIEQAQIASLFSLLNGKTFHNEALPPGVLEDLRQRIFHDKLDHMQDGQVGLMPDREFLAQLELSDARTVLRRLARPLGISANKACQTVFYADPHQL